MSRTLFSPWTHAIARGGLNAIILTIAIDSAANGHMVRAIVGALIVTISSAIDAARKEVE